MIDQDLVTTALDASAHRREERRRFLRFAGGTTLAAGGLALLGACDDNNNNNPTPTPSPTPTATPTPTGFTANDVLNFALNLEYLEAQFYSFAAFGTGLPTSSTTATSGTPGTVVGGKKVNFTDPVVAAYAREIAADEIAHVNFLRAVLGSAAVAQPNLNISGDSSGAFTMAARAANVITSTQNFDPYASDEAFLLGAFIFEDVGVTAYKGAAPAIISNKTYLEAAAGILAAEAYHAGLVRTVLYAKGVDASNMLRVNAGKISDLRDTLDGTTGTNADDDQGIVDANGDANLVPTDGNSIAFSRTTGKVLNIVYGTPTSGVVGGLFFPNGVNGAIRVSG